MDVLVTTASGTSAARASDHFIYKASGAIKADGATPDTAKPVVTAISPNTGPTAGGVSVTISRFEPDRRRDLREVRLETRLENIRANSSSSLVAVAPPGTGVVDVTVTLRPRSTSTTKAADRFTYGGQLPPPSVTFVTPATGPTVGGVSVTLEGTNFVAWRHRASQLRRRRRHLNVSVFSSERN